MHVQLHLRRKVGIVAIPIRNGMSASLLTSANWRKGSRSGKLGNCVELAILPDGEIAVRNSRDPKGPALVCPVAGLDALLVSAKKW